MGTFWARPVIDALHTAFTAAPALDGVTVVKSWEIVQAGEKELLFVAGDGGSAMGNEDIAFSDVEWPGPGDLARTEDGTVDCAASVWTGDQSAVTATIDRAYAIVGACEDVLRADPALGVTAVAVQAKITQARLRVVQAGQGLRAIVLFVVTFQTSD